MTIVNKTEVLGKLGISAKNMGCTAAQIVSLTRRIQVMAEHIKENKKDFSAKRSLLCLLGQRRALLRYCARSENAVYVQVLKHLGLRR